MKKISIFVCLLSCAIVSATHFSAKEEKELVNLYAKAELEYWVYMDNLIQQKEAYTLYKAGNKVRASLRTIDHVFQGKESLEPESLPALIYRFSQHVGATMEIKKLSEKRDAKFKGNRFEQHKALLAEHHSIMQELIQLIEQINTTTDLFCGEGFPIYKKLQEAIRVKTYREQLYLVLLHCRQKEDDLLDLIRQEDLDFDGDSVVNEFHNAITQSKALMNQMPKFDGDEKLKNLTQTFLDFYQQESNRLVRVTKAYYKAMDRYKKEKISYDNQDKATRTQEQYNAFRMISNDVINKQKMWRDERSLQDGKRAKLNHEWNTEAVYFMQTWMYNAIPDYRKPDHISVYTLYN